MYRLPTLISEFHGHDDGQPVFEVMALFPSGPTLSTFVFSDNHEMALYYAACEWGIDDYAFKTRGPDAPEVAV